MVAYGRSTPRSLPPLAASKKPGGAVKVHPHAFNRMQNYTAVAGVQELLRGLPLPLRVPRLPLVQLPHLLH